MISNDADTNGIATSASTSSIAAPSCFQTRIRKDGKPWAKRKTSRPVKARGKSPIFGDMWPAGSRSRMGVPDGMRKKDVIPLWEKSRELGRKFIALMEDLEKVERVPVPGSEQEMAKQALEEAFVMAVSPLTSSKEKAAYLRIVLEFTKAKPESKTKLTLDKSEEWLAALEADMKNGPSSGTSSAS